MKRLNGLAQGLGNFTGCLERVGSTQSRHVEHHRRFPFLVSRIPQHLFQDILRHALAAIDDRKR